MSRLLRRRRRPTRERRSFGSALVEVFRERSYANELRGVAGYALLTIDPNDREVPELRREAGQRLEE